MRLEALRPRHIRDLVLDLLKDCKLARRTVRHVYATLATMFRTAIAGELIIATPCVLPRGVLPKNVRVRSQTGRFALLTAPAGSQGPLIGGLDGALVGAQATHLP